MISEYAFGHYGWVLSLMFCPRGLAHRPWQWISVVLLAATLAIMAMQMTRLHGGHLPQHAPKSLPPGVLALDGWADRLMVLSDWAWVLVAARRAIQVRRAVC